MNKIIDYEDYGRLIRSTLLHNLSLTCGVGCSSTKTSAKLCTYASKRWAATGGVVVLTDQADQEAPGLISTREIWGIGQKISERLSAFGIITAGDFYNSDVRFLRKSFGVEIERTGGNCMANHVSGCMNPPVRQQIIVSRSFGQRLNEIGKLHEAVSFLPPGRQSSCARMARGPVKSQSSFRAAIMRKVKTATAIVVSSRLPLHRTPAIWLMQP